MMKNRRNTFLKIMIIALALWFIFVGLLAAYIHQFGQVDHAEPKDVIVVLGAGLLRNGQAGGALRLRSEHAAQLWREGYAPFIICSGGQPPNRTRSEAEGCRDVLMANGVPEAAIILERNSRSTQENAMFSSQLMMENGFRTAIISSDSYHMFRAQWLFSRVGVETVTSPVPSSRYRRSSYLSSLWREVLAFHWQVFIDVTGLPITAFPIG